MFRSILDIDLPKENKRKLSFKENNLYVFQMLNRVPSGGKLKVEHVVGVLEKRYPYVEISSILGPDSAYDNNRKVRDLFFLICVL